MNKIIFIITISIFFIFPILAQQKSIITGIVLDKSTREPIEHASIRVLNAGDSTYVSGSATNMSGKFTVPVNLGHYILNISYLGYKNAYVNVNATKENTSVGEILLNDDGILLNEAVVTAKAAEIVVKGDTVEYNADSYKVQESAVVEDILKKMPGAEIDSEGKITINGKEVKKILVDGKEFFSDDPKVASKNLPATMIDKLQVLDRKSDMSQMTGFDDGEDETVINLTVKKGMKQGLFGNANAGIGSHGRYEVNAMINYMQDDNQFTALGGSNNTNNISFSDFSSNSFRGLHPTRALNFGGNNGITKSSNGGLNFALNPSKKLKWGGNIRYGNTNNDVTTDSYTQNYISADRGGDQYETRKSWGNNNSDNVNANFKFEWKPDSSTTIIFKPNIQYNKNTNSQTSNYLTTHLEANDSINWGKSDYYSHGDGTSLSGELEVNRQLNKKGRTLSFSLAGGLNRLDDNGYNRSETYFSDPNANNRLINQSFNQKNKGRNWAGYISYVEPLKHNNFLQLTYSYKKNYSETNKITYNKDHFDNYSIVDTASTKKLENNFINQQIELNFKSVRPKYNYTIGIALQPSNSDSWTISPDTAYKTTNNVFNFAPVAQFNYMWDKRTNLRLNYEGSTSQPSTTQLSSVPDLSDPLNITYGNPDLNPTFDNRFRFRFRKFNPEQASVFLLFGGFNFMMNDIVNYSTVDEQGKRVSTYKNVNGNWGADMGMIINRPLRNKAFSVHSMTFSNYSQNNGFINGDKNIAKNFMFSESMGLEYRSDIFDAGIGGNFKYLNMNNSIAGQEDRSIYNYGGNFNTTAYLPYNFTLETDINYASNSGYSNGFRQNEWLWNASLAKQIFKAKNGTLRFKIYDILQQRSNISQTSSAQYLRESLTNTMDSYFMIQFVYRFQIFKGGTKQGDMNMERRGYGRPHDGGQTIRL